MEAAIAACKRYALKYDGLLGGNYDLHVNFVMEHTADDWPSEAAAWYLDGDTVRPSWIDRESGKNRIQKDIDWWNKDL